MNVWKLGTGRGYSVLEMIQAFENAAQVKIPYALAPRRPGDIAECWADPSKAERELGWKAALNQFAILYGDRLRPELEG